VGYEFKRGCLLTFMRDLLKFLPRLQPRVVIYIHKCLLVIFVRGTAVFRVSVTTLIDNTIKYTSNKTYTFTYNPLILRHV